MNSILNSISTGDLQVPKVPRDKPVKTDSIATLLQSSDIEFEILPKEDLPKQDPYISDIEIEFDVEEDIRPSNPEQPSESIDLENILQNSILDCSHSENVENFNTGFGENHDVHIQNPCPKPTYKTPLYYENYLTEFISEEDKAAARHALGLYNKHDVVAMSLLTAEDGIPDSQDFVEATIKQLRKGDQFFAPVTLLDAVFDNKGVKLSQHLENIWDDIKSNTQAIGIIQNISEGNSVNSLGDVRQFLQGFTKETNLYKVIDNINQEMLKFESTGTI